MLNTTHNSIHYHVFMYLGLILYKLWIWFVGNALQNYQNVESIQLKDFNKINSNSLRIKSKFQLVFQ